MPGAWAALVIVAAFVLSGLKVLREYERAVVFRLGRLVGVFRLRLRARRARPESR